MKGDTNTYYRQITFFEKKNNFIKIIHIFFLKIYIYFFQLSFATFEQPYTGSVVKLYLIFSQTIQEYNFKQNWDFMILSLNIVYHGSESTSYLGSKIWEIVFVKNNKFNLLNRFKIKIRNWVPENCPLQDL